MAQTVQLVECPRDAMQGWPHQISTENKIRYINALLDAGFDTIDFGSFVSAKAIPQLADTRDVLAGLDLSITRSALLAIVANTRGAEDAVSFDAIRYLGYPFSVSETFQQRNANSTIDQSLQTVEQIHALCARTGKELVVYLSMGFGNPYGDPWSEEIVFNWAQKLRSMGVTILSLADTVGLATPEQVKEITAFLVQEMPGTTIGVHLHASPSGWEEKAEAALNAGCRRFDGALKGIGGCPMAGNELVGNLDTELLYYYLQQKGFKTGLNRERLAECITLANEIFR